MKALSLNDSLHWVGVLDPDLRVFDIIMHTEFGTTYNSYVLKGSEKTALFETAKAKFFEAYVETVSQIVDIQDVDYMVVSHTEPDHAGSIEQLLARNPRIKIVGTAAAIGFLKQIVNHDFYSIVAKDGDVLSLGDKTLRFLSVPNLHWPDTMYTYIEEDQVLVTCDSFGAHYAHEGVLRSTVTDTEGYLRAAKYYFDNILGPFKQPYMKNALDRVRAMKVSIICPGHGPILDSHLEELYDLYESWCSAENPNTKKTVVMPYVSAYGYTRQLAEEIEKGIRDSGDIDVHLYDMVEADQAQVLSDIGYAEGILFGTPTILCEALKPIWDLTTNMYAPIHQGKYASAFGSYGWSGEGVPHLIERLKQLKLKVMDGYRIRLKPDENNLLEAYEFGYAFGCFMQNKEKKKSKAARTLVKCLVCGEIFDSSLEICPVCGVGRENFVEVSVEESSFRKDTDETFVILGGGVAGLNAATAIRERNVTASIIMVSGEEALPYNRPMLTKNLMAGLSKDSFAIHDEKWYEDQNIFLMSGRKVKALHPGKREVELQDGMRLIYDKCIYALGASNFIPPFAGADQPQVCSIRNLDDINKVASFAVEGTDVVVIGGGVLGLEAAWEMKKNHCNVTILEAADRLMPRQLDSAASDMLLSILKKEGMEVRTGAAITAIQGNGSVSGVALEDGSLFQAQLVIISCGVRANTAIAAEAGLEIRRAVVVDAHMQTSAPHVYACGDCAEYEGVNYAIWPEASAMGTAAGANAAGDNVIYESEQPALSMNACETSLFSIGNVSGDQPYKTIEMKDGQKYTFEKYFFLKNRLCGAILLGDTSKMAKVSEQVKEGVSAEQLFLFAE